MPVVLELTLNQTLVGVPGIPGPKIRTWGTRPGFGLHFPALDADLYIPALLEGFFGSKRWMAARLGELGGKARSAAKARASRANGRMGGRPKKVATAA
jgi:hypothetical protein